ncbi:MAG: hypothetical protein U5K38_12705 [Woeseiaceae bacterium]|nr:hypothetical protein [Woeseiaceae bacterium]
MLVRGCSSTGPYTDAFVERFVDIGRDADKAGDPPNPATNLGPLVTREAPGARTGHDRSPARSEGATLAYGE